MPTPCTTLSRALTAVGTKAMSAGGISEIDMRNLAGGESRIENHRVVEIHDRIILAVDEEDRRATIGNMLFQREAVT